jgi:16S rRNA (uracil1498-N3)-methyltransferase
MHRFYLPPKECQGNAIALTGDEAHHAMRVLRIRAGERVVVLDGAGQELHCEVRAESGKSLALTVIARKTIPLSTFAITLVQAIPKGKIIEDIIEKATELGVARIVPIVSERVVAQFDSKAANAKAEKWQHVAVEAIKQSGNAWLPKVEAPLTLEAFLARREKFDLSLAGCLESGSRHPRAWFEEFFAEHKRLPKNVAVWVGPEGDFTSAEYSAIKDAGARPVTLGPLVLRVETAAVYCVSVVNYELTSVRTAR